MPDLSLPSYPQEGTAAVVGKYEGIDYRIDHRDSNTLLVVRLAPGSVVKARSGSMVTMSASIQIKGEYNISLTKFFTGGEMTESIFTGPGEVMLAPDIWGDITLIELDGSTTWTISKKTFLASSAHVQRKTRSQGLSKGLFSGEGMFITEVTGVGIIFVESLGAIIKRHLQPGEELIVDNGHLVAWTTSYKIERIQAGGFMSGSATDEGLVCRCVTPRIGLLDLHAKSFGDLLAPELSTSRVGTPKISLSGSDRKCPRDEEEICETDLKDVPCNNVA
ncbi:hypothetical protein FRB99_000050 [Tulasnella sp. 403]|nr:hypothetical protein FRB99_000050 [Tulasnella sp. 403]